MERSMTRMDVGNIVIMLSQSPVLFIKNYFIKTPKIFLLYPQKLLTVEYFVNTEIGYQTFTNADYFELLSHTYVPCQILGRQKSNHAWAVYFRKRAWVANLFIRIME